MTERARTYRHPMQQSVAVFHRAFGMPDLIDSSQALPADRVELRLALIQEEGVTELNKAIRDVRTGHASEPVEIIDALIDTIYVALGAIVEMGQRVQILPRTARFPRHTTPLLDNAKDAAAQISRSLSMLERPDVISHAERSTICFSQIAKEAFDALVDAGLDPQPFFDEVQRSNMSKLGEDGRPIHSRGVEIDGYPVGKVLKGPNYSPPDLARIYRELSPEITQHVDTSLAQARAISQVGGHLAKARVRFETARREVDRAEQEAIYRLHAAGVDKYQMARELQIEVLTIDDTLLRLDHKIFQRWTADR